MSYILDALKKSDRERQEETPPHLQHLYEIPPSSKDAGIFRRRNWYLFLLIGLLLFGGWLKWSGFNDRRGGNEQGPEREALRQTAPAPTQMAAQQEPAEPASPAPKVGAVESERSLNPITVQEKWFDDWLRPLPKKDYSLPLEERHPGREVAQEGLPPVVSLTASQSKSLTKPLKIKKDREKVLMVSQNETTVIGQPPVQSLIGQSPPAPSVIDPPPTVPSEKPKTALPYLRDLPPQVQAEIPKLQFAGHAYAQTPSQRLIVVNGMIMREGDQIDAVTKLSEITWEGVIIDRKGVRFQVRCY